MTMTNEQYKALVDLIQDLDACEDVGAGDPETGAYWVSGNVRRNDINLLREFLGMEKV